MRFFPAAVLFVALLSLASGADFRNAAWGMNPAQIKKLETAHLESENDFELVYSAEVDAQPLLIVYHFSNGVLSNAEYRFTTVHREPEKYVSDYEGLQLQLQNKYGPPASNEKFCDDEFYSAYPHRWGTAIAVGKMRLLSVWNTPALRLSHGMYLMPGGTVGHVVEYNPISPDKNGFGGKALLGVL